MSGDKVFFRKVRIFECYDKIIFQTLDRIIENLSLDHVYNTDCIFIISAIIKF